jgi:hypothetical protein
VRVSSIGFMMDGWLVGGEIGYINEGRKEKRFLPYVLHPSFLPSSLSFSFCDFSS